MMQMLMMMMTMMTTMMMMMVRRRVRKRCMRARSEAMPEDAFRSEALTQKRSRRGNKSKPFVQEFEGNM